MTENIIKGYKGIMDLDLSFYSIGERDSAIKQHYQDIEDYKKYQLSLKPKNRYENAIERVIKIHQYEYDMQQKRKKEEQERQNKHYKLKYELYQRIYGNK